MKIKNFLAKLEEQLTGLGAGNDDLTGQYILFVERQDSIQTSAACSGEFIVNSIVELFQNLYEADKGAATKVLALLCMQLLEGESQEDMSH